MASCFLRVASQHLASRNQPHTITAQWSFLNRTQAGRAYFQVVEAKIGRATSVLHITMHQRGLLDHSPWMSTNSQSETAAYITNGNLDEETGVTLSSQWTLDLQPPTADLSKLPSGKDPSWELMYMPIMEAVPALKHLEYYRRRSGHVQPNTLDFWIRQATGERFTVNSLGFVADVGPPLLLESFRPAGPNAPIPEGGYAYDKIFWYPTLTMSLETKRNIPGGLEWLRLRVAAKQIRNGRYDAEVIMFDADGNLVALSNHTALAVDMERNYAKRGKI